MRIQHKHILSFEPNSRLISPYIYIPSFYKLHPFVELNIRHFSEFSHHPDLVLVSASYPIEEMIDFLWQLKELSTESLTPLIFVVDWSQPFSQLPGTTWGEKVGVLHTLSSEEEVLASLVRLVATPLSP